MVVELCCQVVLATVVALHAYRRVHHLVTGDHRGHVLPVVVVLSYAVPHFYLINCLAWHHLQHALLMSLVAV